MRSHKGIVRFLLLLSLWTAATFGQNAQPLQFPAHAFTGTYAVGTTFSADWDSRVSGYGIQGGTPPYSLALAQGSGSYPPGLQLNSSSLTLQGYLAGPGNQTYTFTLIAADSSTPQQTAQQTFTIAVGLNPFSVAPTSNVAGGILGKAYGDVTASGGIPPYSWTITEGTLPPSAVSGLTLNPKTSPDPNSGLPQDAITGTPKAAGTYSFTIQGGDGSSPPQSSSPTYALSVINPASYTASGTPTGIAATSTAVWFTQQTPASIQSINPTPPNALGTKIAVPPPIPTVTAQPLSIVGGPDSNLWITDLASAYIYRVTPDGKSVTPINLQDTAGAQSDQVTPTAIAAGLGSGVWFSGSGSNSNRQSYVGRISTDGKNTLTFFSLPQVMVSPVGIAADPDGTHVWFLANAGGTVVVGRIVLNSSGSLALDPPQGCQKTYPPGYPNFDACFLLDTDGTPLPPPNIQIANNRPPGPFMAVESGGGAQSGIWFATSKSVTTTGTDVQGGKVGRITEDGSSLSVFTVPSGQIGSMAWASDQGLWYTHAFFENTVGRITSSGQNTIFSLSSVNGNLPALAGITVGPDAALWLSDTSASNAIVQIFPSLVLNCSTLPGTLPPNVAINTTCQAGGGNGHYTYSADQSKIPPGVTVTVNANDIVVNGLPTAPGSVTLEANDTSPLPQQAFQVFTFQAPNIHVGCTLPPGAAGQSYSGSCSTAGGTPPYSYVITLPDGTIAPTQSDGSNNLPEGLIGVPTLTSSPTGQVYGYSIRSGQISPGAYGSISFTITAVDSNNQMSAAYPVSISVSSLPLSLNCASNVQAVVGRKFQQSCFGSYGVPFPTGSPYTFQLTPPTALPAGLTFNTSTGSISGTPTAIGTTSVSVVVTDSTGQTSTAPVSLSVVNPKLALVCNLPFNPPVGTAVSTTCNTSGGAGPYSYSVSAGALPAGLGFNATTGTISGTPTTPGAASFTLLVTDSESPAATAQQKVNLFVQPTALTILTTTFPAPTPPLPYAVNPSVSGGAQPYKIHITSGALPSGLQLDPSGTIYNSAGGPAVAAGAYSFTLTVTDAANATVSQTYSGTVAGTPIEPNFTSYALPGASGANGITVGPDGNLWFTTLDQSGGNLIGSITTAGILTPSTPTPSANALTQSSQAVGGDLAAGPDGEVWIAQRDGNTIGELAANLSSQSVYIPPTTSSAPAQITAAPDGALWFAESATSKIAHVDAGGNLVEYLTASPSSAPSGITVGPYNLMVYTEPGTNSIGIISEDGSSTPAHDFPIPTPNSMPTSIVLGSDGGLWFTESNANKIGRIDFGGNIVDVPIPSGSSPKAITLGPDGALYFTEPEANMIGRVTIAGAFTEYPIPDKNSGPTGIVAGPDGSIWFTESNLSKIGRLRFLLAPMVTCTLPTGPLSPGASFSGSCTASGGTPPYQFSFSSDPSSVAPPGVKIDPNTGSLSGTLTTAGTFTFTVSVTDSLALVGQQSYTFTVTPLPLTLTCNAPIARLYTTYDSSTVGCTVGETGLQPYSYSIASGALPPGLSLSSTTGNITGVPTTLGDYSATVQVTDGSMPPMTATQALTISVQYGLLCCSGSGPLFTLSTPPLSLSPGVNTPGLTLSVNETLLEAVSGSAVLSFTVGSATAPAGYMDPALQFVDAKGNPLGTSYNFTFEPGTASVTLPAIDPGTVVGTLNLVINGSGLTQLTTTIPVVGDTPVIEPGSVQFTNVTATGFDVEFVAMVPLRRATSLEITFNPTSGDQISGQESFVFDVSEISNAWFETADGLKYGGRYSLTVPFVFDGQVSAIGSATVTLDDSEPVTGNR